MKRVEQLMAAARGDADQQNAWLKDKFPHEADDPDEGVLMLRHWADHFDQADLKDEGIRTGIAIACKWVHNLGTDYSCCDMHGDHLIATARMLLSTLAREETHP